MNNASITGKRPLRVLLSLLAASLLATDLYQVMFSQELVFSEVDFTDAAKTVDKEKALPGSELSYTIVLSYTGSTPSIDAVLTDTLVTSLSYISGSLSVDGGGLYGESGGVITWTGSVNNDAFVSISFDAFLTDTVEIGTSVPNTAVIAYDGVIMELPAVTEVVTKSGSTVFLPLISKPTPSSS